MSERQPGTTAKSPYDMTAAELQAEIGRLQAILHRKVCGDPMGHTSLPITEMWQPSEECLRDIEEIERAGRWIR